MFKKIYGELVSIRKELQAINKRLEPRIFMPFVKRSLTDSDRNDFISRNMQIMVAEKDYIKKPLRSISSRHRKENHIVIVVDSKKEESAQHLAEEIKKTIHKENRLLEDGVSFQINCNLRKY